ncbi:MAG: hypothetical protein M3083_20285 [Actinomycetota bacterium]|nr:hypothetical protein [Actinomycetota bacterium]MDQ6949157.1 hypothetical protein [Actinomycetota bacterium]
MASPSPGFDTSRVSPSDANVTVRSLPRRFAEAFDRADSPDDLVRRPPEGGLSPLEHAAWTAEALEAIGSALGRVLVAGDPQVELPPVNPPGATGGGGGDPAAVLARLGDAARSLADAMADGHGQDWSRTGRTPSGNVSALDIARLAVRIGVEHLRAAEEELKPRRG